MVTLRVINRLDEALIVDRITIRKPKRALLRHWETALADLPAAATLRPAGRASAVFQIGRRNASATFGGGEIVIYVIPPAGWSSGMIRLDLRISSKAATLRDRRIVVHAMTSAKPSSTTDENASMTS